MQTVCSIKLIEIVHIVWGNGNSEKGVIIPKHRHTHPLVIMQIVIIAATHWNVHISVEQTNL